MTPATRKSIEAALKPLADTPIPPFGDEIQSQIKVADILAARDALALIRAEAAAVYAETMLVASIKMDLGLPPDADESAVYASFSRLPAGTAAALDQIVDEDQHDAWNRGFTNGYNEAYEKYGKAVAVPADREVLARRLEIAAEIDAPIGPRLNGEPACVITVADATTAAAFIRTHSTGDET